MGLQPSVRHGLMLANLFVSLILLQVLVHEAAPLLLFSVLLAALWFGRWGGAIAGILCGVAGYIVGQLSSVPDLQMLASGAPLRSLAYASIGWTLGWLLSQRQQLTTVTETQAQELDELRILQEALVPVGLQQGNHVALHAVYQAATDGVAGDFYLSVAGPQDTTICCLGDVQGKGIDAASAAHFVRITLLTAAQWSNDPAHLLQLANTALSERLDDQRSRFVTAVCCVIHPDGRLQWANAGHFAPLLQQPDGAAVLPLPGDGGMPLGILPQWQGVNNEYRLQPQERIWVYSDGITEARPQDSDADSMWELDSLEAALQQPRVSLADTCQYIVDQVQAYGQHHLADDICILGAEYQPLP